MQTILVMESTSWLIKHKTQSANEIQDTNGGRERESGGA